jgi:hypothetical protein
MKSILLLSVLGMATICLADNDAPSLVMKKPADQHRSESTNTPPQILYHGGHVLGEKNASVPVYVIYYGNFFPSTTKPIIDNFIGGLSAGVNQTTGTAPFAVNSSYCEAYVTNCPAPGPYSTSISGVLKYVKSIEITPSQGSAVNSTAVIRILQSVLTTGDLPADDAAIYVLITDPTIKVTGFPNSFCAYHTHSTSIVNGFNIHYAFAPEPATLGACDGNFANRQMVTPNGDAGADEITDSLMHEFSETVSDPDISAWYTSNGEENGDLCNYNYGTWSSLPTTINGATYNTLVNGQPYLVQLIWLNKSLPQYCAPAPAP